MKQVSRRSFVKYTGGAGIAIWLGLSAKGSPVKTSNPAVAKNFSPFILVESNGNITVYNTKPEMGQGTFQAVPAMIAEDFEVSLDDVIIKGTNGEKEFGDKQRAGGSSSIRTNFTEFRKMGAAAKEVFIQAAATKWSVDSASCYAERGKVFNKASGKSFSYGELVEAASKLELPKEPILKNRSEFKIIGKVFKRADVPLKTNGSAEFGIDATVPGMLFASIERSPVIGGTLKSFDAAETLKMPGVIKVVEVERIMGRYHSTGVAVIAKSYWEAQQARKKLQIVWDNKGHENFNTDEYEQHLRDLAKEEGLLDKKIGDVDAVNPPAENVIDAFYETPMAAHHTLEPLNCIAQVTGDKLELWTSSQVNSSLTGSGANDLHKFVGFKRGMYIYDLNKTAS